MFERTLPYLIIVVISYLNNLLVPFAIYHKKYGLFRKKYKEKGGCNGWGIFMDGVLAGLINVTVLNFLSVIQPRFNFEEAKLAFLAGFTSMVMAHVLMSIRKWETWIMPKPWHWNTGGYWHMISMTLQMSFLFYPVIIIVKDLTLLEESITRISLFSGLFWIGLFVLSWYLSNRGIKIGRFHLNKESW